MHTEVGAGATLNRRRGAVIRTFFSSIMLPFLMFALGGDIPNTGDKPILASVEENSKGGKLVISGIVNDIMGAQMSSGKPKLGRVGSAESTDDEKFDGI